MPYFPLQKLFLIGILVFGGILIPLFYSKANPATLFETDFEYSEGYELGNINGQVGWVATGGDWVVNDEKSWSLLNSLKGSYDTVTNAKKQGEEIGIGQIGFWAYFDCLGGEDWGNKRYRSGIQDVINEWNIQVFTIHPVGGICEVNALWVVNYWDYPTWSPVIFDIVEGGQWYYFIIEWNSSTDEVRSNFNGEWSEWQEFSYPFNNIYILRFDKDGVSLDPAKSEFFIDYIAEEPSPECGIGHCNLCEISNTCIEAGCVWYYSFYGCQIGQCFWCIEPFEPEEEECGEFWKCQYCMTQETCEAQEGFCLWENRGLGNKCYMVEPVIPPEQIEWKTCVEEMENCEELGLPEKWICYLKNLMLGQFCPEQAKLTKLFNTLGAFKDKFPFNYISAIQTFFSDVKASLSEEKSIPITILGAESEVNFSFWEKTGEVGGTVETIKNVVFDFITLILVIGFLTWLLAFVRKFW